MTPSKHRQVTDELQRCIGDTQCTIGRFEITSMDEKLLEGYDKLLKPLDAFLKQQRKNTILSSYVR